jgi:cytochrome c oxidase subunit 1
MHWAGLLGAPRRVPFAAAVYTQQIIEATADKLFGGFTAAMLLTGIGGVILGISGLLYFGVIIGTLFVPTGTAEDVDVPLAEALSGPANTPAVLDRWRVWIGGAVVVIMIAYIPTVVSVLRSSGWNAPGLPFFR